MLTSATTVVSLLGAALEFPPTPVARALALRGGALLATAASSLLTAADEVVVVGGGLLGCMDCVAAADAQVGTTASRLSAVALTSRSGSAWPRATDMGGQVRQGRTGVRDFSGWFAGGNYRT